MGFIAKMKLGKTFVIGLVLVIPFGTSCSIEYTTQHFSFPPGSKPHENDWKYTTIVMVSSNTSPITKKSKKVVEIKVYDTSKTPFLSDEFKFVSASIRAEVVWEKFEDLRVELFEVGNKFANDPYNADLLKAGPKRLLKLKYEYDEKEKKFRLTK